MILSKIKKFVGVLKDGMRSGENSKAREDKAVMDTIDRIMKGFTNEVIVIKHGKNNSLIKCWKCKKEAWVLRGSKCYRNGLCGRCI